jgi:hypothetical protein
VDTAQIKFSSGVGSEISSRNNKSGSWQKAAGKQKLPTACCQLQTDD